jgi:hypothetical protein
MGEVRKKIDDFCSELSTHEVSSQGTHCMRWFCEFLPVPFNLRVCVCCLCTLCPTALAFIEEELANGNLTLTKLVENAGEQLTRSDQPSL